MNPKEKEKTRGHIVFDHDGTLVNTSVFPYFLFDGMREFLVELKSLGFKLYVWTARPRRSTTETMAKLDINTLFTDIYCYDDGIPKPSTMGLEKLTGGISKKDILHIGDSLTDFEGAKAFGIEVIAACWNNPDQVNKYKDCADYTAANLNQCREIIKGKFHV